MVGRSARWQVSEGEDRALTGLDGQSRKGYEPSQAAIHRADTTMSKVGADSQTNLDEIS